MNHLSAVALLLSVFLSASILHAEERFHPEGKWTIRFQNNCSGSSTYSHLPSGHSESVKGGDFVCSSYLPKTKPPSQDELSLDYSADTQTLKLTGGPSNFPRTVHLDQDKVGVSDVKLFPKTTSQGPGCDMKSYARESVKFTDSNQMLYGYVMVYEFVPRQNKGCDSYLSELETAIKRRTATGLLLAMRDANAVSVNHMKNLSTINVFDNYTGTRRERG